MSTAVAVQVKERPLIFSGDSVRAILAGTQTQTRRVITPQPEHKQIHQYRGKTIYNGERRMWCWKHLVLENILDFPNNEDRRALALSCPHGKPGEQIWVRESFQPTFADGVTYREADYGTGKGYAVTYPSTDPLVEYYDEFRENMICSARSPIYMPRWASRITLEITDVRVQRLQEISEEDAIAEGCKAEQFPSRWLNTTISLSARANYKVVWDRLNGKKYPWNSNHFVRAISFRKITR